MAWPNHDNVTASEAKFALQISTMIEKRHGNGIKYHIILGNLMEYEYQGMDPGSKV